MRGDDNILPRKKNMMMMLYIHNVYSELYGITSKKNRVKKKSDKKKVERLFLCSRKIAARGLAYYGNF